MSNAVGSYLRGIPNQADEDPFNVEIRRTLDGLGPAQPEKFENWSPEQIKEAYEGGVRHNERLTTIKTNADEFILRNPEFLDTASNADLITKTLKSLYGEGATYTVDQFSQAYDVLRATGARLDIDQAEVVKQQAAFENAKRKAYNKQRADKAARVFDPNGDYDSLSLEEIRARANEAVREEMQLAAERGGNGW